MAERIWAAIAQLQREYPEAPAPDGPAAKRLVVFAVAITVVALLFWLLESRFADRKGQPKWRGRPDVWADTVYLFILAGLSKRLGRFAGGIAAILLLAAGMPRATAWVGALPLWVQAIGALVIGDFTGYWTHRALHRIPRLWRLHTVHHSSENLDWLAAARVHPFEVVINQTASIVPIVLLGFSPLIAGLYGPFLALYPIFLHANVAMDVRALRRLDCLADVSLLAPRDGWRGGGPEFRGLVPLLGPAVRHPVFPRGPEAARIWVAGPGAFRQRALAATQLPVPLGGSTISTVRVRIYSAAAARGLR